MDSRFIRSVIALGVPGLALGVFYLLLKAFNFQFSQISPTWTAAIIVLFLLIVFAITLVVLNLWRPVRNERQNHVTLSNEPLKEKTKLNVVRDVSDEEFNELLDEIEQCLKSEILSKHELYDAYISCPMASCEPVQREQLKSELSRIVISIQKAFKLGEIECPAVMQTDTAEHDKFDDPKKALKLCFKRILYSKRFIMIYPQKLPTSSIFEVGLAMAFCKPITIFLKKGVELPFLIQKIDHRLDSAHIYRYENSLSEIESKIAKKEVAL